MDPTQLLKGVLDLAVLATLERGDSYGYAIVMKLREAGYERIGEASVYGTLRRLSADGAVSNYSVPSDSGPNRKYYALTDHGVECLHESAKTWRRFAETMDYLLEEGT